MVQKHPHLPDRKVLLSTATAGRTPRQEFIDYIASHLLVCKSNIVHATPEIRYSLLSNGIAIGLPVTQSFSSQITESVKVLREKLSIGEVKPHTR